MKGGSRSPIRSSNVSTVWILVLSIRWAQAFAGTASVTTTPFSSTSAAAPPHVCHSKT